MPEPTDHSPAPTITSPSEGDLTGPWPAPAPARPAGLPEQVGRYRLGAELARGGMGAVVEALDPDLGRRVAVKVLLERHQGNADLVARFLEEAQLSGQLQHPGLVPVYELGRLADGRPFFTMKLVHGRTLADLLDERPGPGHDLSRFLPSEGIIVLANITRRCVLALVGLLLLGAPARAEQPKPKVYVILWFDTEDYILPASDDAALRVANFLTAEGVRATFKVVGEKARTLERRKRLDVIAALKKHEIGYHSNFHSVQPTPALYLANLGWDEGVAEFDRREGPGRADVARVFGQAPACYGQPGSSWGPQSYGAMRKWGMKVYLDAGSHVALEGQPCYYGGLLNLYHLEHTLRADLNDPKKLGEAEGRFAEARKKLLAQGGGVVSIFYHPCEWVHKEFWDGANFRRGANPPRSEWKRPEQKGAGQTRLSYRIFADYIHFLKRFPDVTFIAASEAAALYRARQGRVPGAVWLGSTPVPPEAYLRALARVALDLLAGKEVPARVEVRPTTLAVAKYVAPDSPKLWGWVIFPPGFKAPALMDLARRQAWTLKPAYLSAAR